MDEKPNIKEQDKQQIIDQLFSLINQIDDISKTISKSSNKTEPNNSNELEKEWIKWSWTEFEIAWKNKEFKGRYWWNSKDQNGIEWIEEKPDFGEKEEEIIYHIKNKIKQKLPMLKKKEIWQLAT
jgi:hypothetical protein